MEREAATPVKVSEDRRLDGQRHTRLVVITKDWCAAFMPVCHYSNTTFQVWMALLASFLFFSAIMIYGLAMQSRSKDM